MILALSPLDLHVGWAWVVVISNAVVALWALGAHVQPALRGRGLWIATVLAQGSVAGQVMLGAVLVAGQGMEAPQFHMFYGFVALISITLLYGYRVQLRDRLYLLYGFGGLFVMGLAIRAMVLG